NLAPGLQLPAACQENSGRCQQLAASCLFLGPLRAVFRAPLAALVHAGTVERATHGVVTDTWKILHTTAANEHDRVLLQVVTLAADVADHLETVRQAHLRDLTQRRVRLLRRRRVHASADAALLRTSSQGRNLGGELRRFARFANELTDRCHKPLDSV